MATSINFNSLILTKPDKPYFDKPDFITYIDLKSLNAPSIFEFVPKKLQKLIFVIK